MENKSSKLPVLVTALMLVLSAGAVVWNLISLIGGAVEGTFGIIGAVAYILTGILAIVYIAGGHTKKFAGIYIASEVTFALAAAAELVVCVQNPDLKQMIVSYAVITLALLVMIFVKNMGRDFSYVLVAICLITGLSLSIQKFLAIKALSADGVSATIFSLVLLILVYAKFKDKANRGRWTHDEAQY